MGDIEKIENIFLDKGVIDWVLEPEDIVADYDFIVEVENKYDVKKNICGITKEIENMGFSTHILYEQIEDSINEGNEIITFDIYINK